MFQSASFYDGDPDPDQVAQDRVRVFEDSFEDWEQNAIDGTGEGPRIRLSVVVKADKPSKFKLQEKYKGLYFVDKDPDGDNNYYDGAGDPVPNDECENRKIMGLIWENHRGWRVETKLCDDMVLLRIISSTRP